MLDGFAAMAFASSFGVGVLLSAVSVLVVQGLLTLLGVLLGSVLPDAHIAALTATGGLMLVGIGAAAAADQATCRSATCSPPCSSPRC